MPQDYRAVIEMLPEDDQPAFFGLPANIARSSQCVISAQVSCTLLAHTVAFNDFSRYCSHFCAQGGPPGRACNHAACSPPPTQRGSKQNTRLILEPRQCVACSILGLPYLVPRFSQRLVCVTGLTGVSFIITIYELVCRRAPVLWGWDSDLRGVRSFPGLSG